jgi:hypothetical protein
MLANEWENVDTVISRDVCSSDNIHPPVKSGIARRIADILLRAEA